ncbi:MAG: STAS-like domain-containing protein [Elusimicrobia bacterium]|nr:STAS-like domain-containing protein [Elusimicrobiota bacterium]
MNNTVTISIRQICGAHTYTRADAAPLYKKIEDLLLQGEDVAIDFENREVLSESFLDEGIVEHFMHPRVDDAAKRISMRNVSRHDKALLLEIYDYRSKLERKQAAQKKKKSLASPADVVRDVSDKK